MNRKGQSDLGKESWLWLVLKTPTPFNIKSNVKKTHGVANRAEPTRGPCHFIGRKQVSRVRLSMVKGLCEWSGQPVRLKHQQPGPGVQDLDFSCDDNWANHWNSVSLHHLPAEMQGLWAKTAEALFNSLHSRAVLWGSGYGFPIRVYAGKPNSNENLTKTATTIVPQGYHHFWGIRRLGVAWDSQIRTHEQHRVTCQGDQARIRGQQ